ncbi:FUSC family protein [Lacinutrix sp. Bg11-31]|uniref:FUSC family protein n=1 Tax=Lacinutrix sp. Bg11-31 TaxID=2057808 RepID=UPI000C312218|nr:FUSC family protein [Lacinutrix sp. Bg11-31]AUC81100.1 FUSC family protein [Lacinutrix sp. Bg11-31]
MRLLFIILGLISAVFAVILAVLPLSNFAFFPAIAALIFGVLAFIKTRGTNKPKHTIQLILLLTIISLVLATYKSINATTEVGDTEQLEQRAQDSEEDAIEELNDLDISE